MSRACHTAHVAFFASLGLQPVVSNLHKESVMVPSWRPILKRVNPLAFLANAARRQAEPLNGFRPFVEPFEDRLLLSYSFGAVPYQFVNLEGDPAAFTVINHADDLAAPVNLGSNQFNFFGTSYGGPTSLYASSNGLITFGSGNSAYSNTDLTNQPTQAAIAPLWTDWLKTSGGPMLLGKIDVPNNQLILEWDQILHFQSTTPVTFEVFLQLNTGTTPGNIGVSYAAIDTHDHFANGATATVGIKDVGSQIGQGANRVLVSFNSTNPLILSNQALQFTWNSQTPPPVITSLSAASAPEGSSATFVTVFGSNFGGNSVVQLNGSPIATNFVSATQLQAMFPAFNLAEESSLTVTVVNTGSTPLTSNPVVFIVTDAALTPAGLTINPVEGVPFTGVVATFSDGNLQAPVSDFRATITWGDNNSSAGTISATGQGNFTVSGTNVYAEEGTFPISVQVFDLGGASTTARGSAIVGDAPLTATGVTIAATEGTPFSGPVATFTDANLGATAADFSAQITWAPGQTSAGTVTFNPGVGFTVSGSFTFPEEGTYPVSIAITDIGGASAQAASTANVADAALTATGIAVSAIEGASFKGVVATFTDANPGATAAEFTAIIGWGDGHTSVGAVTANSGGGFTVSGTNTFAEEGNFAVNVTISDQGSASAQAAGTAAVADAPLLATAVPISATQGVLFSGMAATFTDANPGAATAEFMATIEWGDGSSSSGTIAANSSGGFTVSGDHTYTAAGAFSVDVLIQDQGGSTATAAGTAQVVDANLIQVSARLLQSRFFPEWAIVAGSFSDQAVKHHTARVDWGDGTVSTLDLCTSAGSRFFLIHHYSDHFIRLHAQGANVTVTVSDDMGDTSDPVMLTAHFPHHHHHHHHHHQHHHWGDED